MANRAPQQPRLGCISLAMGSDQWIEIIKDYSDFHSDKYLSFLAIVGWKIWQ